MEFLDLENGHSIRLALTSYELGTTTIVPRRVTQAHVRIHMQQAGVTEIPPAGTPIANVIPVLRVFGTRLDTPSPLGYWDISSKRLTADLLPRLQMYQGSILTVTITAAGEKPTKVFSVEQGG